MFAGDGKYIPPPVFMLVLLSEKCYTGACGKNISAKMKFVEQK